MAEELYINSVQIELPKRTVAMTYQINELAELRDRQADYSNNIKIPKSASNVQTMEMLGIAGNLTRLPYTQVSIKYIIDGVEIIADGKGIIKNTDKFYNLLIYDGNITMIDALDDFKLQDLDWSAHNHNLTLSTWQSSFSAATGYIYGLGKFYSNAGNVIIQIDTQGPSFYIHTLFSMIFTQAGFTVSGDIITDADFKSRVTSMEIGFDQTATDDLTVVDTNNTPVSVDEEFGSTPTTKEYEIHSYTTAATSLFNVNLNGTVTKVAGTNYEFIIRRDGSFIERITIPDTTFDIDRTYQFNTGEEITVNIEADSEIIFTNEQIKFDTFFTTTFETNDIFIPIDFSTLIGEVKQIDFVKEVMQRFGLIIRKTRNSNNYEFKIMNDLLNDRTNAENWSDKYSEVLNETYKNDYAQTNVIKFKYDDNDSDTEETFADGEFFIDDVNLPISKDLFTSIFKASILSTTAISGDLDLYVLNQWVLNDDNEVEPNLDGLRIFKITSSTETFSYRFNATSLGFGTFTGTTPFLDFTDQDYQTEIFNYYQGIFSMLNDYRKITVNCDLNVIDIYNIDFFKLKYFKQLGQYYYLNKVINFRNNRKTKVELIEANVYTEIQPPDPQLAPFITEWTVGAVDSITLPTPNGGTYDYVVNYGDGSGDKTVTAWNDANASHTYTLADTYAVTIKGTCTKFLVQNDGSIDQKLTKVTQWGFIGLVALDFYGCSNLTITATDTLQTQNMTSFDNLFRACPLIVTIPNINNWFVRNVTTLARTFSEATLFNDDIGDWDTRNVTILASTFELATKFNQYIGDWDTSKVANMDSTFQQASDFNQPLTNWITDSVTTMKDMFRLAADFNQSVSHFVTSLVTTMSDMFSSMNAFNQPITFDTGLVTTFLNMFNGSIAFNQDLGSLDISLVTSAINMLDNMSMSATNYSSLLQGWKAQSHQNNVTLNAHSNVKYIGDEVDSGTTDGTTANKLVDSTQNFTSTVVVGDVVVNLTDDTHARVTNVDSDGILSLDVDIMISGETYSIQHSDVIKDKAALIIDDGWTITDGGTTTVDTTPPSVPTNLQALQLLVAEQIDITWTASTDDVGVSHYEIWKGTDDIIFLKIATEPASSPYNDTDVVYNQIYYYKIKAVDTSGNKSDFTASVNETPEP